MSRDWVGRGIEAKRNVQQSVAFPPIGVNECGWMDIISFNYSKVGRIIRDSIKMILKNLKCPFVNTGPFRYSPVNNVSWLNFIACKKLQ